MGLRYWGLLGIVVAWISGLLCASLLPIILSVDGLLIAGAVLAGSASVVAVLAIHYNRERQCMLPLALLWGGTSFLLAMARFTAVQPAHDPQNIMHFSSPSRVTLRGIVAAEPEVRSKSIWLTVTVTTMRSPTSGNWQPEHGTIIVHDPATLVDATPDYGDAIEFVGILHPPNDHTAPGIAATTSATRIRILRRGDGNPLLVWVFHLREALAHALQSALPAPEAALAAGILLGMKTPALRQRLGLFTSTGTIHLVVTSGLKVTLVGTLITGLVHWLPRWLRFVLILTGIAGYVILSGMGPAAWRAGLMGSVLVCARQVRRDYDVFRALALTILLMTLMTPLILWDVGFQLSVAGTLGIAILAPRWRPPLQQWLARLPAGATIADVLAATAAAQVATLPIVALAFGIFSLISLLANLLLVPFLSCFLILGAVVGGAGLAAPALGTLVGWLSWPIWRLADIIIEQCAAVPGAALAIGPLPGWVTPLWILLICLVPLVWKPAREGSPATHQRRAPLSPLLKLALGIMLAMTMFLATLGIGVLTPAPLVTVAFLDVGAGGQAIVVRLKDGLTVLIDGGSDGAVLLDALPSVLPFWQHTIDLVIATDGRAGHVSGLLGLSPTMHVLAAADAGVLHPTGAYTAWYSMLQRQHIPLRRLTQGERLTLRANISLDVLAPTRPLRDGTNQQDANALILRLVTPAMSILLAGDTDGRALSDPQENTAASDIIQLAQRPTDSLIYGTPAATLITASQPRLIVMTSSAHAIPKKNQPTLAILPDDPQITGQREILRTSQIGTVMIQCDGHHWWVNQNDGS